MLTRSSATRMVGTAATSPSLRSTSHRWIMNKFFLTTSASNPSPRSVCPGQLQLQLKYPRIPGTVLNLACFHTHSSLQQNKSSTNTVILPSLMDFPLTIWPSVIKTLRNWFFYHFVIRSYMDKEFNMGEFDRGARQAVSIVSKKLASGKLDELEGLVDSSTLAEVKQKLSTFSVFQRGLLNVETEDIFFSFPHEIGIIIPDPPEEPTNRHSSQSPGKSEDDGPENRPPQKRYVEITVVFHILRGFREKSKATEMKSLREFINSEDRNNVMVLNYRFFKDFTQGVENPTWIINMVNHFLPSDHAH